MGLDMEKNKKWIRLFFIFLAVMWLLTIISTRVEWFGGWQGIF